MDLEYVFLEELSNYYGGQTDRIRHASSLSNYGIRMHKERLDRLGYRISYAVEHRNDQRVFEFDKSDDGVYRTTQKQIPIFLNTQYIHNGNPVYSAREDKKFVTYAEDLAEGRTTLSEDALINCPNCGFAGTVNSFRDGCDSCGAHFEMTDIFPAVGAYYFMDNYSLAGRDVSTPAKKLSVCVESYKKMFKVFSKIPTVIDGANTFRIFHSWSDYQAFIKQYIPDFSYVHFANTALSMMTMMLYSDAPEKLPFNKMVNSRVIADNLIDFAIEGFGMNKDGSTFNGNVAYVTCSLLATCVYDVNGKVRKSSDKFQATLARDITRPISQGFSFTRINCPTCGGVFDVMKGKYCPFCGNEYNLNNEEWVLVDIRKM